MATVGDIENLQKKHAETIYELADGKAENIDKIAEEQSAALSEEYVNILIEFIEKSERIKSQIDSNPDKRFTDNNDKEWTLNDWLEAQSKSLYDAAVSLAKAKTDFC